MAVKPPYAIHFSSKLERYLALFIFCTLDAVSFIISKGCKRKQTNSQVVGTLMGEIITVMGSAEFPDQRNPHSSILFKL